MKESIGIMYFRRDLRLKDNTALNKCIEENKYVVPLFIYDDRQIDEKKNEYYNAHALDLLNLFVTQLNDDIYDEVGHKISIHKGNPKHVIRSIISNLTNYEVTLYFNMDFTPFAIKRDEELFDLGVTVKGYCDHLLVHIDPITSADGLLPPNENMIYKKFTPFYNYYSKFKQPDLHSLSLKKIKIHEIHNNSDILQHSKNHIYSRKHALQSIKAQINYHLTHDNVYDEQGTFNISHYLKFGVISIREVYHAWHELPPKDRTAAIRQLFWRDFYTMIAWANPKLLGWKYNKKWEQLPMNSCLYDKYNLIRWSYDHKIIKAWQEGKTGFPIVDAGMRQLLATGYMHNRARLITASFLTKICGIDWRVGEKWFAKHLIDYDPIINNGNWLWVAGGGADSQPYFRVFNPWLQQKKYDPKAIYIKKWVPELKNVDVKVIHQPKKDIPGYHPQIIVYEDEKENTYAKYKKVF